MRTEHEIRQYLKAHWFVDKSELRQARDLIRKNFTGTDFTFKFYIVANPPESIIRAYTNYEQFKNYYNKL